MVYIESVNVFRGVCGGLDSGVNVFHIQHFQPCFSFSFLFSFFLFGQQSPCFGKVCVVLFMARLSKLKGSDIEYLAHFKVLYIFTVTAL